jgi:hypothetical protein
MAQMEPVPGKSCGTCTLCCKVYPVPVLEKSCGKWCKHCSPGKGCGIWLERPEFCREFYCRYMLDAALGPEWKPEVCKFVMNYQPNGTFAIAVDPGHRTAWRSDAYYARLKRMSGELLAQGVTMYVEDGVNRIIVTPDEDVVAGRVSEIPHYEIFRDVRAGITSYRVVIKSQEAPA